MLKEQYFFVHPLFSTKKEFFVKNIEVTYCIRSCIFQGAGGICVKKTGQALVMGIYDEPVTPGQCNMIVERLGDYLIEQGL